MIDQLSMQVHLFTMACPKKNEVLKVLLSCAHLLLSICKPMSHFSIQLFSSFTDKQYYFLHKSHILSIFLTMVIWSQESKRLENKSLQMSQKFYLSGEKTTKKVTLFQQDKPKRFTRKRSDRDRSVDSKRSRDSSFNSHYIKSPGDQSMRLGQLQEDAFNFVQRFNTSLMLDLEGDHKSRKTMYTRTNTNRQRMHDQNALTLRIEMLETQHRVKEGECERLRLQLDEQREKRRKSDAQRRTIIKEIQQLEKTNQRISVQNKKLLKEKQYLVKQVQFLEKINYDQKTRHVQSFREKYMAEELEKLRNELKNKRTPQEKELETECEEARHQRDIAEEKFKSMKSLVEVLKGKIDRLQAALAEEQLITKQKVQASPEYQEIKQRYRRFIETYKEIRAENWSLRNALEGKETVLELSDSDGEHLL